MKSIAPLVAASLMSAMSAGAITIYSNLGAGDSFQGGGRLLQGEDVGTIANVDQATSFTMGATSYFLTSLELGLGIGGPGIATGPLDVILAADNGGQPGAALETISLLINATGQQLAFAPASGSTMLVANTTYWVIADARGTLDGGWNFNDTGATGTTAGRSATSGTFAYGAWNIRPNDTLYALRVEGNEAQVPDGGATLGLLGLGLVGFAAVRRRIA